MAQEKIEVDALPQDILSVENVIDLTNLLNRLPETTIARFVNEKVIENWFRSITNWQQLCYLFSDLSAEKVAVLNQYLGLPIKQQFLHSNRSCLAILVDLPIEKQQAFATYFFNKDNFPYMRPQESSLEAAVNDLLIVWGIERGRAILPFDDYIAHRFKALQYLIGFLPKSDRLSVLKIKNNWGNTVFHQNKYNYKQLKTILELLPESERIELLMIRNNECRTVFSESINDHESLKSILESLPKSDRIEFLMKRNNESRTVFNENDHESLKSIMELLPERDRYDLLKVKDAYGNTMMYYSIRNHELLRAILPLFTENRRVAVLQLPVDDYSTLLHHVSFHPGGLRVILELLSPNQRLKVLQLEDSDGCTTLQLATWNPENYKAVEELCGKEVLYSVDHPYRHYLYEHRYSIATVAIASVAAVLTYFTWPRQSHVDGCTTTAAQLGFFSAAKEFVSSAVGNITHNLK